MGFFHLLIINPLNAELNPIRYLLALLGAHHFLHISRIRVNIINTTLFLGTTIDPVFNLASETQ